MGSCEVHKGAWHKTGCICCAQNCGLEVLVEKNRIVKVRGDRENPRSEGYVCRKGLSIGHYEHHAGRLTMPLRKTGNGFEEISWDQALAEISEKLKGILQQHGPRSLAYVGGGGQGCHFEAAFAVRFLRGLGSRYHYSPLAQELTGMFWVQGRTLGRQYLLTIPDHHNTDMLVAIGWNGWMSHQMPQARRTLKKISEDPDKLLVVIDPRRSETAQRANIHLALRPGTDALLTRAMIAIILNEGLQNNDYLKKHVSGLNSVLPWFADFDAAEAIKVCGLDYQQVRDVSRLFATRKSAIHPDLGIFMNRHSTVSSYLEVILCAMCGRIGVPGGNVVAGNLMPLGSHSDERDPRAWRTLQTNFPAIMGTFPPNVMPEEILSDNPERLRAVIVSGANPLRSYADTSAYERACERVDLLVTIDVALSETALRSHYVLPARSAYEKWDGTFFAWTYPEIFFQVRRPILEPEGEPLEESDILMRLADRMDLLPEIPATLSDAAASGDRMKFGQALLSYAQTEPRAMQFMPFVLGKTLGVALGSPNLAALWGLLQIAPASFRENAARAGFGPGIAMGEQLFRALMDHPEGLFVGECDPDNNLANLRTDDHKINVFIPELEEWVKSITPESEERALSMDPHYPLILIAGRHVDENANTIMRDPAWNTGRPRSCTLAMHSRDADALGLANGQLVKISTEAGHAEIELELDDNCHPGQVVIPHGFGLIHDGKEFGINVNRLTKNTHRDPLAATPLHRFVPCRVESA
ncbi:MAG TPA: molybdopterin-dependent oxidoreductase [Desulfomonilaceae bacterium]|nr:molybdopterin-dependent oxidoreductase [Desulfomonilaceae bacterium]